MNNPNQPEEPDWVYVPRETPPPTRQPQQPGRPPPAPESDPWISSQPHPHYDPMAESRYHEILLPRRKRRRNRIPCGCCLVFLLPLAVLLVGILAYALFPMRTNLVVLGIDARPGEGDLGRSDTTILVTFNPWDPYVRALSIPRDLWVTIPGAGGPGLVGENRINTAHFYAEANQRGSGPQGAMEAIRINFGVDVYHYIRLRFDGFREVVDALGGVDIELSEPMSGYPAGQHHLNGEQALALVRDREGSDDFSRMERGQFFLRAVVKQGLRPTSWLRLPAAFFAAAQATDTNLPPWHWPRLGMAILRVGVDGMDTRSITREMVTPYTTNSGAQVLLPVWERINPVLFELFGQ